MSVNNFKPIVWSGSILSHFEKASVFRDLLNTNYEGDISSFGDTVKINSIGDPTIKSYTTNSGLGSISEIDAPEILQDSDMILVIDQAKYWNFGLDDVDKAQIKPQIMDEATKRTAYQLRDTIDTDVATILSAGIGSGNTLTAATSVGTGATDDDAYEIIVDLGVKLTENNVPYDGRWVVIPPWMQGMLCKDPRFTSFGTVANNGRLMNGMGAELQINGMSVRVSNNVPANGGAYTVMAGVNSAATFAEQILKTEAYRPQGGFADAIKGLCVYGRKVLRPYALAKIACTQA